MSFCIFVDLCVRPREDAAQRSALEAAVAQVLQDSNTFGVCASPVTTDPYVTLTFNLALEMQAVVEESQRRQEAMTA